MREIKSAPTEVVTDGYFNFGCYNEPIENINLLDVNWGTKMFKKIRLREWQAFQIKSDKWFIMAAIYNSKTVALVQFIIYNLETKEKFRYEKKVLAGKLNVPSGLTESVASYTSRNFKIRVAHNKNENTLEMKVSLKGFRKLPNIEFDVVADHNVNKHTPMVVVMPFSKNKGMYSHKCLMPVQGTLKIDNQTHDLKSKHTSLIIDDHKGYYPYPTKYDWNTGLGFLKTGERFGFNLTDNQVQNHELYNENCIWIDGKLIPLNPIKVSRPNGYKSTWYIKDEQGDIDISFQPEIHNSVNLNLGLIASKYEGPYGYFTGTIKSNNRTFVLDDIFGMGEEFYLKA